MPPLNAAQAKIVAISDGDITVRWLNESEGNERRRILAIRDELNELGFAFAHLLEMRDSSPASLALKTKVPPSPDAAWTAKYRHECQQVQKRIDRVNKTLSRYVFHPGVGGTATATRNAGLLPDSDEKGFILTAGESVLLEADVALALVRLYLVGGVGKVQLCEMCEKRWRVKAKSPYRFCTKECREAYYSQAPDYHSKKAKIQREYRMRKKQAEASGVTFK